MAAAPAPPGERGADADEDGRHTRVRTMGLTTWVAVAVLAGLLVAPAAGKIVHRYTFDGADADDAVGGLDGAATGTAFDAADAKQGSHSALFDGADDTIDFSSTAFNADAFSVALWVKPDNLSTFQGLLANKGGGAASGFSLFFTGGPATQGRMYAEAAYEDGGGLLHYSTAFTEEGVMDYGVWRHVAYTFDVTGGQAHIYLDGVDKATDTAIQSDFAWDGPWRLGLFMDDSNDFDGRLDDVQIYDEVLSAGDVAFLASNPGAVIPEPVTLAGLMMAGGSLVGYVRRRRKA